jgi:hypothetical protein
VYFDPCLLGIIGMDDGRFPQVSAAVISGTDF